MTYFPDAVRTMQPARPLSLGFTAIDFETANASRASACAVGLAKVPDDAVVDSASWLIAPPLGLENFASRNVAIHGISPGMVVNAPTWERVFPEVMSSVGSDDLVAHNAPFDRSVFQQVCSIFDLDGPDAGWYDTLPIARRLFLERWVCSGACTDALKRAAKRAWSAAGIPRPAAPTYAETYSRR